jgi:capsular polysaccharide biosynthesis protein
MSYLSQYALWRSAAVVVGVHGGNLGGALWLSPGQALVEIGFKGCATKDPTQYAHVAVGVGAKYRCVPFREKGPHMKETGGSVDPAKLHGKIRDALTG